MKLSRLAKQAGLAALVASVLLVGTLVLTGFRGGMGHCRGPMDPAEAKEMATSFVGRAMDKLDATDAQEKQIQAIADKMVDKGIAMHENRKAMHAEVLGLIESASPDRDKVHAMVDAHIEELRAFAHEAADAALEAHAVLTPEQRQEVADMVRDHQK